MPPPDAQEWDPVEAHVLHRTHSAGGRGSLRESSLINNFVFVSNVQRGSEDDESGTKGLQAARWTLCWVNLQKYQGSGRTSQQDSILSLLNKFNCYDLLGAVEVLLSLAYRICSRFLKYSTGQSWATNILLCFTYIYNFYKTKSHYKIFKLSILTCSVAPSSTIHSHPILISIRPFFVVPFICSGNQESCPVHTSVRMQK
jgi:hypothetical protein